MAQTGYQNSAKVTYVWRILNLVHIMHSINKIIMNNKQYYHTVGAVPKSNRKSQKGAKSTALHTDTWRFTL